MRSTVSSHWPAIVLLLFIVPIASAAEKSLTCHEAIEPIGKGPVMSSLPCTACHTGEAGPGTQLQGQSIAVHPRLSGDLHPGER